MRSLLAGALLVLVAVVASLAGRPPSRSVPVDLLLSTEAGPAQAKSDASPPVPTVAVSSAGTIEARTTALPSASEPTAELLRTENGPTVRGSGYEARFSTQGLDFRGRNSEEGAAFRYELSRVVAGPWVLYDRDLSVPAAPESVANAETITFARAPGLTEFYEPRGTGIEQLFRVETPLPSNAGLRIEGAFDTRLRPARLPGFGVAFAGDPDSVPAAMVTYGEPTLIDADGRRCAGSLELEGNLLVLEWSPDQLAGLSYPLVVDPLIGSEFAIATGGTSQLEAAVAWDSVNDRYLVVWQGYNPINGVTFSAIYGQRFDASGSPLLGQFTILDRTPSITDADPDVAYSPQTQRYVVVAESGSDLYMRAVNADGSLVGAGPTRIDNAAYPGLSLDPKIVYQNTDRFLIIWCDRTTVSPIQYYVLAERRTSAGAVVTDDTIIAQTASGTFSAPAVAHNSADDRFYLVWTTSLNIVNGVLRSGDLSQTFGSNPLTIESNSGDPGVAWNSSNLNQYQVVWQRRPLSGDRDIAIQVISSGGAKVGSAAVVDTFTGEDAMPSIRYSPAGNDSTVVYAHTTTTSPLNRDTYSKRIASNGSPVGSRLAVHSATHDTHTPANGIRATDGKILVAWTDARVVAWDIYGQFVIGNRAPTATPKSIATNEDTAKPVVLTGTDPDGDPLTFAIATNPAHGAVSGTPPNVTYTPAANYNGADSFTYTSNDGAVTSVPATVSITVNAVNDAPVANAQSVSTNEDTAKAITLTGSDVEGSPLTFAIATNPSNGTLSGSGANRTYTPALNYNGPDSFTFTVNDGTLTSTPATVSITVSAVNDAPVANAQSVSTNEDTAKAITLTGSDVEGSPLTFAIATNPSNGTLSGSGANRTYTPALNYNGPDSFTFTVNDGSLTSAAATVSITVNAVNDAPVANPQSVSSNEDTAKAITLTGIDVEGSALTFAIATNPSNGSLSGSGANRTYTPDLNYNGPDSFTFTVNDGSLTSAAATVSITVNAVNDTPVANPQSVSTNEDTAKAITLTGSDVEGSPLTFAIATNPSHGSLSGSGANRTYAPARNYNGPDSFTFTVNDGALTSAPATVSITITAVNDAPVANAQSVSTPQNLSLAITLTGSDVENQPLTIAVATNPTNGTLLGTAPNVTYTPASNYTGADSFTFTASDGSLTSTPATISITVTAASNGPWVRAFYFAGVAGAAGQVIVVGNGVSVTVNIATETTGAQAAHQVAAELMAQGIQATAVGGMLTITTTTGGPAQISGSLQFVDVYEIPATVPAAGLTADQLPCCSCTFPEQSPGGGTIPTETGAGQNRNPQALWSCQETYRGDLQIGYAIFAHSGEFGYQKALLHVPGRGMDYDLILTYRSQNPNPSGNVGPGWSHNWQKTLSKSEDGSQIFVSNGFGRVDVFDQDPGDPNNYVDGPGLFRTVTEEGVWAAVRDRYGTTETYYLPNGLLDHVTDRNGNVVKVLYTQNCNVKSVIDTLGRVITYNHEDRPIATKTGVPDFEERLVSVIDFTGRTVTLTYATTETAVHSIGDLIAITSPAVTESALDANNFPAGKTTQFTYDTRHCPPGAPQGCGTDMFWHNMLTVTEPGETSPSVRNVYGEGVSPDDFDRVIEQELGSTDRTSYYMYERMATDPCADIWITEVDPKGHKRRFFINAAGHLTVEEAYTGHFDSSGSFLDRTGLRPLGPNEGEDPALYTTTYTRNADGLVTQVTKPDGTVVANTYYTPSPATDPVERMKRGNLIQSQTTPGASGGSPATIVESWTYESVFNQMKTQTSPRGFVTTYKYDYEEAIAGTPHPSVELFDADGDMVFEPLPSEVLRGGNVVEIAYPPVNVGVGGTQLAEERVTYNAFAQPLSRTRAEANVDVTEYFPESNPTGALATPAPPDGRSLNGTTGGLVKREVKDESHLAGANSGSPAPPTQVEIDYGRDALGRVFELTDGRGVIMRTHYNELDQAFRAETAVALAPRAEPGLAPLSIETLTFYDARDRIVQTNQLIGNAEIADQDSAQTPFPDLGYASVSHVYEPVVGNRIEDRVELSPGVVAVTQRVYDRNNNVVEERLPEAVAGNQPANKIQSTYDELDRVYTTTQAPGTSDESSASFDYYFTSGKVTLSVDGRGNPTLHFFDGYERETETIDARGGTAFTEYDASGNVIGTSFEGETAPGGPVTLLSEQAAIYDERERKTATQTRLFLAGPPQVPLFDDGDADGWVETATSYDRESRVLAVTNDNDNTIGTVYDGLGRAVQLIDPLGNRVETTFDQNGNPTLVRSVEFDPAAPGTPENFDTEHAYDAANRRVQTMDNALGEVLVHYDGRSLAKATFDQEGNSVRNYFDVAARQVRTEWVLTASGKGPGGGQAGTPDPNQGGGDGLIWDESIFDLNGRVTARIDDNGNPTEYDYSNRNLLVLESLADFTFSTYAHDENGNVIERQDPNATVVTQDFDELNRLTSAVAVPTVGNPWNITATLSQSFEYDGLSRMDAATDPNFPGAGDDSRCEYTYDSLARVVGEEHTIGTLVAPVTSGYDGVGNLTAVTYPAGRQTTRSYDELERLCQVDESAATIATYAHIGPGRVKQRTSGNGVALTITYDLLKRPTVWDQGAVARFEYGYDKVSNRLFERRVHEANKGKAYAYDSAYRLLDTQEGVVDAQGQVPSPTGYENFSLDGVGNRVDQDKSGNVTPYATNDLNQYTQVGAAPRTYDPNGNLLADGVFTYRYDYLNRLRSISRVSDGLQVSQYLYDGRGRRIRKAVTNSGSLDGVTTYLCRESQVFEERDGANQVVASYVYGNGIDAVLQRSGPSGTLFYHPDALGSTVAITGATGVVLERYRYEPFGLPTFLSADGQTIVPSSGFANGRLFTGREWEQEVELYYYRARFYDPSLGRFITRDPAGFVDGLNLYQYVRSNPLRVGDPLGLCTPDKPCTGLDPDLVEELDFSEDGVTRSDSDWGLLGKWTGDLADWLSGTPPDRSGGWTADELVDQMGGSEGAASDEEQAVAQLKKYAPKYIVTAIEGQQSGVDDEIGRLTVTPGTGIGLNADGSDPTLGEIQKALMEEALQQSAERTNWGDPETLQDHFDRHGSDFGATDPEDYANRATEFLTEAHTTNLPTKIDDRGGIRVYDPETNSFGAYNPDGSTRTFYKPTAGEEYWEKQPGFEPWTPKDP